MSALKNEPVYRAHFFIWFGGAEKRTRRLSPCELCARGRESQSHSPLFRRSALVGAM